MESITKKLVRFSIPLILTGLLQQLFTWADTWILGHKIGQEAIAAVGTTNSITSLYSLTMIGFTSGISILAARYYGARENEKQKHLLGSFVIGFGLFMTMLAIMGQLLGSQILVMMHTPSDILVMAQDYLHCVLLGIPFLTVYNVYGAVLRGHSDSKAPFLCMAGAGVLNVLLDLVFVYGLSMGMKGAALATVLSQAISCISVVIYTIGKYEHLRFSFRRGLFQRNIVGDGIELAMPITIRSIISAFGSIVLQNFMNGFGSVTVAAITSAYRVDCVLLLPAINFATGISTMVSQAVGEKNLKKGNAVLKSGMILMISICAIMSAFICVFGGDMVRIFGVDEEAALIGARFFLRLGLFYVVFGMENALSSYLEGRGYVLFTGIAGVASLGVRIAMSYALVGIFDNMVIAWAECIAWTFLLVVLAVKFFRVIMQDKLS